MFQDNISVILKRTGEDADLKVRFYLLQELEEIGSKEKFSLRGVHCTIVDQCFIKIEKKSKLVIRLMM